MKRNLLKQIPIWIMMLLLLSAIMPTTAQAASGKGETRKEVHLRKSPTTTSESIKLLKAGEQLTLLSLKNDWYQVKFGSREGYVRQDFVRVLQPVQTAQTSDSLRKGDQGSAVLAMQKRLAELKYLKGSCDGVFGEVTEDAVISFQNVHKLTPDGVAGTKTLALLYSTKTTAAPATTPTPTPEPMVEDDSPPAGSTDQEAIIGQGTLGAPDEIPAPPKASDVELADWWTDVSKDWKKGTVAWVYDPQTGLQWRLRIFSIGNHADCEPYTLWDTQQMKKAFGGKWTWTPKSIWITLPNGRVIACSTHDMPHMSQTIKDNGFDGHLCVHFLNSRTHNGNANYTSAHQAAVQKAWELAKKSKPL